MNEWVVSHAIALLLGALLGVVGKSLWEEVQERRREDGRTVVGLVLAVVVAAVAVTVLVVTPLELHHIARWRGIRWAVALMCGAAALTMVRSMVRQWPTLTRRLRAIGAALIGMVAAEAYFQVEAFYLHVPVTGVRNLIMLLVVTLLFLVQLIDWGSTERRRR